MKENRKQEFRLMFREHFIIQNIRHFLIHYIVLWMVALVISVLMEEIIGPRIEMEFDLTRFFASSVITIAITTITLAIPSCMRMVFSAYEDYYSTSIREILIERFPITLLTLSSFTALLIGMAVNVGALGKYIPIPLLFLTVMLLFWGLVCVYYLFMAIEKLVYFIVKAPGAVLDKLEFGIFVASDLNDQDEYDEFRQKLASINDIAATIVQKSTGRDEVIVRCLNVLHEIHHTYLKKAVEETDPISRKRHFRACRAVFQELVRVYREAVASRNEHATSYILKTYARMVNDIEVLEGDYLYVTEAMALVERFQSYAKPCDIEVIQEQAATDWFFYIVEAVQDLDVSLEYTRVCIVREMAVSLRNITVENKENLMYRFMRVTSDSDLEIDLKEYNTEWVDLLDRVLVIYLSWLFQTMPENREVYARYLVNYSRPDNYRMRSVLPDSYERVRNLFIQEHHERRFESEANVRKDQKEAVKMGYTRANPRISARTQALMGNSAEPSDENRVLAYLAAISYADFSYEQLKKDEPRAARMMDKADKLKEEAKTRPDLEAKMNLLHMVSGSKLYIR